MILSGVMETSAVCQAPGFLPLLLSHCQSQSGCSLLVSATTVPLSPSCPQSPGPDLRAEVRYQCRPDRFSTELTCTSGDNTRVSLACGGRGLVTILSASYLEITPTLPLHCPDTDHTRDTRGPGGCDNNTISNRIKQR